MKMLEKYFVLTRKIFAFTSLQYRSVFGKSFPQSAGIIKWNSWHAFSYVLCLWRFWKTKKESFQSNYFGSLHLGLRPYGQPGPLPLMVTLVALLIELEAQIL